MNRISFAALALAVAMSPAFAADLLIVPELLPEPDEVSGLAGYVEVAIGGGHGSVDFGYEDNPYGTETWNEIVLSGAARVAMPVASDLVVQLDGWVRGYSGEYTCEGDCEDYDGDYTANAAGVAAHLSHVMENSRLGGMISLGTTGFTDDMDDDQSSWATVAVEGQLTMDNFRLYGQAGASKALSGFDADDDAVSLFARGVLAYYLDPNFRISGNVGVGTYSGSIWSTDEITVSWGARVEKRFEGLPFSLFAAYQGWAWSGENDDTWQWDGSSHAILVGARFPFGDGTETLQDLDETVGLRDMNFIYGDLPN